MKKQFSRRDFLKLAGGASLTVASASLLPRFLKKTLVADEVVQAASPFPDPDLFFAGTDGWFWLPPDPPIGIYHPDSYGPATLSAGPAEFQNFTTYIFGFRNVTGMTDTQRENQQFKVQHNAPFFWVDQYDENKIDPNTGKPKEFRVQLTNLGLHLRPDLTDAHTIHWHGFRNVIPFYDGEPHGSISVPVGQFFTYVYRPRDPGTYMYHCHVEDVEHVTMGMTSLVFVRPLQNGDMTYYPSGKYAYNDGDGSTGYDRENALFLSEIWAEGHWGDAHIQESDWSTFKADFSLINGRVHPDTLLPNSPINLAASTNCLTVQTDSNGDLNTNPGYEHLQYNPHSSLITCNAGERVLLRFANLGFREAAMTLAGIKMNVIGRDASPMKGRDGTDTSYLTNTILMGAGESFDCIFEAPAFSGGSGSSGNGYDTYILYNRRYTQESNLSPGGSGGQRTEVRVYPAGTLGPQQYINQHPDDLVA
ncbi:MAG: multicopper oxidase domain-containing protein [Anaerolineales bacterium]